MRDHLETLMMNFKTKKNERHERKKELKREEDEELWWPPKKKLHCCPKGKITLLKHRSEFQKHYKLGF